MHSYTVKGYSADSTWELKNQEYKNSTLTPLKDDSGHFKSTFLKDLRHNSNPDKAVRSLVDELLETQGLTNYEGSLHWLVSLGADDRLGRNW